MSTTTVREQQLLNWLHAEQQKTLNAMGTARNAIDHGRQQAAFDALASVWEKMNALLTADITADAGVSE